MSFGCTPGVDMSRDIYQNKCRSSTEQAAIKAAYNAGVTIIAAAGNGWANNGSAAGSDYVRLPAHYDGVISVGNLTPQAMKATSSDYGKGLDIMAPGTSILSTWP